MRGGAPRWARPRPRVGVLSILDLNIYARVVGMGATSFGAKPLSLVCLCGDLGRWDPGSQIPLPNSSFSLQLRPNKANHRIS